MLYLSHIITPRYLFPGEIVVSGILDRESRQQYTLNVSASDLGIRPAPLQGYTLVSVTVDDFNDNSPEFDHSGLSLSVSENVLPPAAVGQVTVTDTDTGDNGVVTCMLNTTGNFIVNISVIHFLIVYNLYNLPVSCRFFLYPMSVMYG